MGGEGLKSILHTQTNTNAPAIVSRVTLTVSSFLAHARTRSLPAARHHMAAASASPTSVTPPHTAAAAANHTTKTTGITPSVHMRQSLDHAHFLLSHCISLRLQVASAAFTLELRVAGYTRTIRPSLFGQVLRLGSDFLKLSQVHLPKSTELLC